MAPVYLIEISVFLSGSDMISIISVNAPPPIGGLLSPNRMIVAGRCGVPTGSLADI
jgi:hypothetical protein